MRTFAGPAMLAAHGRITGLPRIGVLLAATGEIAADKSSQAPDRTTLPALVGRLGAGAYTGTVLAGPAGAAAGALAAGAGTFASWRARSLVVDATGLPDPVVAVGEDILAMGIAAIATRPDPNREPGQGGSSAAAEDPYAPPPGAPGTPVIPGDGAANGGAPATASAPDAPAPERSVLRDAGVGLLAGIAGTVAMTVVQGAEYALTDAEPSDAPADVADRIKRATGRGRLRRRHRRAANQGMHWLYGASWGVPYGIVAGAAREVAPEVSGPVFGLLVWGAGLAHQPVLGIAEVPWKRSLSSLGSEAFFHLVYGVGAGAAVRALSR
jgi:hypothetical protein